MLCLSSKIFALTIPKEHVVFTAFFFTIYPHFLKMIKVLMYLSYIIKKPKTMMYDAPSKEM